MKLAQLVVTTLISIIFVATSVALPVGAQSGGIGGRPANPNPNNPRTQSIFIMDIDHGQSKTDTILVVNNTDQEQTVELYAVDGVVANSGAYSCRQESEPRQAVGSWTTIAKDRVTLGAGEREEVEFQVTVPDNADVGEHNGCIVFQTPESDNFEGGSVRVHMRQAVRLVATIPGELHREINIASFEVGKGQSGRPLYQLNLQNKGNVSADIDAKISVKSLFGREIYTNGGGYPVIANEKLELAYEQGLEGYPMLGGWYRAEASIAYDEQAGVFGTDNTDSLITKTAEDKIIFLAPTMAGVLLIIVVVLLAGGLLAYVLVRRRQTNLILKNGSIHHVKSGETVQTIAQEYGMKWRSLVAVNKIRPPYTLTLGQKLRVPNKTEAKTSTRKKK